MNNSRNTSNTRAASPRTPSAHPATPTPRARTTKPAVKSARKQEKQARGARRARPGKGAAGSGRAASARATTARATSANTKGAPRNAGFMRYAADSRLIQTIYDLVTGPWRFAFFAAVVLVAALGIYFPVRDLYTAHRTGQILERQLEIREAYNDRLQSEVDKLLSTEGIGEIARSELGLVSPGEHAVEVIGIEDEDAQDGSGGGASSDGSASGDGSEAAVPEEPSNSVEVEAAERAVLDDVPWYIEVLDTIFQYQGVEGQTVTSAGE